MRLSEQIKQQVNCRELYERHYGTPRRWSHAKAEWRGERNGSCNIREDRWKDHATDEGGSVIDLYAVIHGMSFLDALKAMAHELGIESDRHPMPLPATRRTTAKAKPVGKPQWPGFMPCPPESMEQFFDFMAELGASPAVAAKLTREKSIGWTDWKGGCPVFLYATGQKARPDPRSSRGNRWNPGSSPTSLWRWEQVTPECETLFVTEGETDLMALLPHLKLGQEVVAVPAASYSPHPSLRYALAGIKVVILQDNDEAGDLLAQRWEQVVGETLHVRWPEGTPRGGDVRFLSEKTYFNVDFLLSLCQPH